MNLDGGSLRMPDHVYLPRRRPPTVIDRVIVHPMDHAVAVLALFFGVMMSLVYPLTGLLPAESLRLLHPAQGIITGAFFLLGGTSVLVGLQWRGEDVSRGWAYDQAGWVLCCGALMSWAMSSMVAGLNFGGWMFPFVLALGCWGRWWAIQCLKRQTRAMIRLTEEGSWKR